MADPDSKSEEEKIQAMLQQSSDQWDEQQDQLAVSGANAQPPVRSPQQFRNPMMGVPTTFNPMMNFAMLNPQLQFQMMMQQQMQQMQQTRPTMAGQSTIPPESQKPPVGYVCFKCRQPGHWIYYCPNVPKGQFVPRPGMNGSSHSQRVGGGSSGGSSVQETQKRQKPTELTCRICGNLMRDAVLVPCCGKSFCKECITKTLDETHKCPVCNKDGLDGSQVIPNRSLRSTVLAYKEQHAKEAEAAAAAAAAAATAAAAADEEMRSASESAAAGGDNEAGGQEADDVKMENSRSEEQHNEQRQSIQQQQQGGPEHEPRITGSTKGGGMPIQVFESEERAPRGKHKPQDPMMPDTMGGAPPFPGNPMMMGGPPTDMSWMMGMPPGLNPAAAAAMMRMNFGGMGDGMGPDFPPDMEMGVPGMPRMPLMNPAFQGGFGGPDEMWNGGMGPMPGMPPPDGMMPFNPMAFSQRGGFGGGSSRGRGGGRGGRIYSNTVPRRRGEQPSGDGEGPTTTSSSKRERAGDDGEPAERAATVVDMAGPDEAIPTAPRADRERYAQSQGRYRPSSSRSHRRRSRTPSRSRSPRRDTHHRRRSPSRSRSKSPKRSSRRRSPSESRSQSVRRSSATAPQDEKTPSSPRSHRDRHSSSRSHRSSRHHSSKYRSREREKERSRDRSGDRSGDKSRRRDRR